MTETIFYVLMFSLFFNFSIGCISYSNINRTFLLMNRGVYETALATIGEEGNPEAYFDETKLKENVETYLSENMPFYIKTYTVAYYFFDYESDLVCTNHFCNAVKISIKCDINMLFHYEKGMDVIAKKGTYYE